MKDPSRTYLRMCKKCFECYRTFSQLSKVCPKCNMFATNSKRFNRFYPKEELEKLNRGITNNEQKN